VRSETPGTQLASASAESLTSHLHPTSTPLSHTSSPVSLRFHCAHRPSVTYPRVHRRALPVVLSSVHAPGAPANAAYCCQAVTARSPLTLSIVCSVPHTSLAHAPAVHRFPSRAACLCAAPAALEHRLLALHGDDADALLGFGKCELVRPSALSHAARSVLTTSTDARNKAAQLAFLQAMIIELCFYTPSAPASVQGVAPHAALPDTLSTALVVLKPPYFVSVREHLDARAHGPQALAQVLHPSRAFLRRAAPRSPRHCARARTRSLGASSACGSRRRAAYARRRFCLTSAPSAVVHAGTAPA
jgi:hypothetical protein